MDKKEFHDKLFDLRMKLSLLGPKASNEERELVVDEIDKLKHQYAIKMYEEMEKEKCKK